MFFDAEGNPVRMVGFMLDVTDRHDAQAELRRLEQQLRQAQRLEAAPAPWPVASRTTSTTFWGRSWAMAKWRCVMRPKEPGLHRDLDSIILAGERGRALVDRILTFSRSGVGERFPVHVEKVVREALDLLEANLPEGIRVEATLGSGRAAMLGDPTQVHQVLMNLGTNAVQAMFHRRHFVGVARRGSLRRWPIRHDRHDCRRRLHRAESGRHWQRHRARSARAHLRPILHDQGSGRRHRPRPAVAGAWHRHAGRWCDRCHQRAQRRQRIHGLSAARRRCRRIARG